MVCRPSCDRGRASHRAPFGLFNGLLITVVRLPPFIATLGSLSIGRGLMYMLTHGVPLTPDTPDAFTLIGQGYVGLVPVPVVIMLAMASGSFRVLMRKTRFGRHVYATGGNELAARLSGGVKQKPARVKLLVDMLPWSDRGRSRELSAFLALSVGRASLGVRRPSLMSPLAAAAIGGASLCPAALVASRVPIIGAALAGIIANGVVLMNIDTYAQQAITGAVILIAVSLDVAAAAKAAEPAFQRRQ